MFGEKGLSAAYQPVSARLQCVPGLCELRRHGSFAGWKAGGVMEFLEKLFGRSG
jgi:hypothetical protein